MGEVAIANTLDAVAKTQLCLRDYRPGAIMVAHQHSDPLLSIVAAFVVDPDGYHIEAVHQGASDNAGGRVGSSPVAASDDGGGQQA